MSAVTSAVRAWRWAIPALVVMALVGLVPLVRLLYASLFRSSATVPDDREFVGLGNYGDVLGDRRWWAAVLVTLLLVVVVVVVQLVLGGLFAAALRQITSVWPVLRVLILLPAGTFAVVSAVVWQHAVSDGFLRTWFRIDDPGDLDALGAVALAEIWRGTGLVTVIVYIGLMRVNRSALESAVADGATPWQRFKLVLWPAAAPAVAVAVVFRALDTMRVLEGPLLNDDATSRFRGASVLVWNAAFESYEQGLASAAAVVLLVLTAVVGALLVVLLRVRRVV